MKPGEEPVSGAAGYDGPSPVSGGYPPHGYPPPGYPPPGQLPPGAYPYPIRRPTNTMAILSIVFAFVFFPLGIIFGNMAKKQIAQTGEEGETLATVGIIVGWVHVGLYGLICGIMIVWFLFVGALFAGAAGTAGAGY
jgi:hypothetical protein